MNDIKFRAWDKEDSKIRKVLGMSFEHGAISVELNNEKYLQDDASRFELMQYTGLKDVNGVEIYEGDILKSYEENQPTYTRDSGGGITDLDFEGGHIQIGIVEFISCSFSYKTVRTITGEHQHKEIPIDWLDNYEVIGNVHEYPELLGDSQ